MAQNGNPPPRRRPPAFTKEYHYEPYDFISPSRPELSVAGKNVVVTGGGTSIGKGIAMAFARAGANSVTILGRREHILQSAVKEIAAVAKNAETRILCEVADLTSKEQTQGAFESVKAQVGPVHIFVSNAATDPGRKSVLEQTAEDLTRTFELNCITGLYALQSFTSVASTEQPMVINISSAAAHAVGGLGLMSSYAITKTASLKLFFSYASDRQDVHVVHVHPGFVWSEMTEPFFPREMCPDDPNLAGCFCVWLVSPEARFLRNKFLWVNWDAEELIQRQQEIVDKKLLSWSISGLGF